MHSFRFIRLITSVLLSLGSVCTAATDFDKDFSTWQTLGFTFHDSETWRIKGAAQSRFYDDSSYLATWLVSPAVEYKFHPNLDIGAAYLLEDVRSDSCYDYTRLHIFWLYLAPHWKLNEQTAFSMRHVLGYRAIESRANNWVSRHRFALSYKLVDWGALSGIGAETELFYNYYTDRLYENRLKPLKLNFSINDYVKCQLYFMLQSKRFGSDDDWRSAYVFGQALSYRF
jgi:hypothetical protein